MSDSLFNPNWYRVANLHPRLISHASISRQSFRGEQWHVVTSRNSGRQFRLNHIGYQLVGRLDGRRTVQQVWDILLRELRNDAPSQTEVLHILSELNAAGLIHSEQSSDLAQIFDASARRRAGKRPNLLSLKVPLFDPTALLGALLPLVRGVFKPWVLIAWLAAVICALVSTALHWNELSAYAAQYSLAPATLIAAWFCYPVIKACHELAHGLAIRHWGGEVHEVGVTVFLLVPIPYVDASSASAFPEKHRRILVSAMGIIVETVFAMLALLVWLGASNELLREIAFTCMMIGGVSTVLVNANPLMRYDGYYMLTDWLELPGLAARADAWLRYLGERWVLGNRALQAPPAVGTRPAWLIAYGIASLVWRVLLFIGITTWLAAQHVIAGILLGCWLVLKFLLWPLVKLGKLVFGSTRLSAHRGRAIAGFAALLAVPGVLLFIVPMHNTTMAQGVVWSPEDAQLRNDSDGFVSEVLIDDGAIVKAGQPLIVLSNPELLAAREQLQARIASLEIAYQSALMRQPAQAQASMEARLRSEKDLAEVERRIGRLTLTSPADGQIALPGARDLPGRFLQRGSLLAHVITPDRMTVRAVLRQDDIAQLKDSPRAIEVRLSDARTRSLPARLTTQTPAAGWQLPSSALGDRAGGLIATDPADSEGLRTLESFFQADLLIEAPIAARIGSRAWIRIEHARQPLGQQWLRKMRQSFLRQLDARAGQALGTDL